MHTYKSQSFIKKTVNEENISIINARQSIKDSEAKLESMGIKLYSQFRNFVTTNKHLYDDDFIESLSIPKFSITQVVMINAKGSVRLRVEPKDHRQIFVMIPLLFISDVNSYKNSRTRKVNFGKDATDDHINKHYDGEINKLNAEIDRLKAEKASMSTLDNEWS